MSFLARNLFRQLMKRQNASRQISAASLSSSHKNNREQSQSFPNYRKMLAISCTAGLTLYGLKHIEDSFPKVNAATAIVPGPSRRTQFNFIADVVETAAKSLVYIEIQDTRRMDYFTGQPATVSNGSGFIVESDGLILTNAHVVVNKPRSNVSVRLSDGRTFIGNVEAIDPVSDLATVRIQCKNLTAMKLGQSSTLRAGEFVIALGSPLCKFY